MTTPTLDGFDYTRLPGADGAVLNVAHTGRGTPIVLLHGFPQTHLMWRPVATALAADHTVVVPDLRGYGQSDKPTETSPQTYSKRTMARDDLNVMHALGHDRFAVISQDWGGRLGFDPTALWGAWAPDLTYEPINAGHFMAEEDPATVAFIRRLLTR